MLENIKLIPNILYDARRIEKWPLLMQELYLQGIEDFKIWEPVDDPNSVIRSINISHKRIINWAKESGQKQVLVFEEDVWFPAKDGFKRFIEDIPIWPFDMWLGGTYGLDKPITGKTEKINGIHCFVMAERFYDTFLSVPDNVHIDTALDGKGLFYVAYPFYALQRPGWSANSAAFSDKNADLNKEDIYYG